MTAEEMQRFLDHEALRGTDELEAWRALAQIIGIGYPAEPADGADGADGAEPADGAETLGRARRPIAGA